MCESIYQSISGPDSHRCSDQRLLDGRPRAWISAPVLMKHVLVAKLLHLPKPQFARL